jgi:cohesin complex subunit SA-1/2
MPGRLLETMASSSPAPSASGPNVRTSGRVRKQTTHFTTSDFSTGKRKRDHPDNESDDPARADEINADDESDEDDEDDEADEEELREQKKRSRKSKGAAPKRPAQKKPKTHNISLPFRAAQPAARKRATKKVKAVDSADAQAAGGLYADIFAGDKPSEEIVAIWMKAFDRHESRALADVINFVLKSAGCDIKITEHDIEDVDGATSRLTDIQDEYMASEPTDYPLIAKGRGAVSFKQSVADFVVTFVKSVAANGLLFSNPELIENIEVWFSTMTSAASRSIRHTSTLASLNVITALCDVAKELKDKSSNATRQAASERKKSRVNKDRAKQLDASAKSASEQYEFVEGLIKDWFDVIFIHRYRDVDAAIRRDCVEAIGDWFMIMPDIFFDGHHLRYLGWVLSDQSPATRGEDVRQLRRLYSDDTKLAGLKTFTERFRSRLVEIGTADSDVNVRIAGIDLLDVLRENELLQPDDIDAVGRMIFHDDLRIRKAVAGFFAENVNDLYTSKLESLGGLDNLEDSLPETTEGNYSAPRLEWLRYKALAEMLQSYDTDDSLPDHVERSKIDGALYLNVTGVESRFSLPVAVLYPKIAELEDWLALAGYLLFDHSTRKSHRATDDALTQLKSECITTETEEIILLEVLNAAVRLSLEDLADKSSTSKGKLTKQQRENLQDEQEESVRHLIELIPQLLKKFGGTPGTAAAVLRLESVLASTSLQNLRQNSSTYGGLLDDLSKQFMSHGTDEVLAPATAAIFHARSYGELDDVTADKLAGLWEDVINNLSELLNPATIAVRGASKTEELLALANNLRRTFRLSMISDCTQPLEDTGVAATNTAAGKEYHGAIDFLIDLILRAVPSSGPNLDAEEAALEDQVAARAAEAALHYFQWSVKALIATITTGTDTEIPYKVLEALAERRDAYVTNLAQVLEKRKPSEEVCVAVAGCLLDLYTVSNVLGTVTAKPGMSDDYTVLIMDFEYADSTMKVFLALEKNVARLSNKQLDAPVSEDIEDADAEPIDDDPMSDIESDADDEDADGPAAQQTREAKLLKPLLAQMHLCKYTSKLVLAISAGVIRDKTLRKRLELNKTKLGPNFKEVLAFLDVPNMQQRLLKSGGGGAKGKAKPSATLAKKSRPAPKSNAIVAEDDEDDEIEDDGPEEEARQRALQEEEEEAMGDADDVEEDGDAAAAAAEDEDEESVIGD